MKEYKIEQEVVKYAKQKGWLVFKWKSDTTRGVPDRILFQDEVVLMIEFKRLGQTPTVYQQHFHNMLKKQGFLVHVVDSVEAGKKLIDSFAPMLSRKEATRVASKEVTKELKPFSFTTTNDIYDLDKWMVERYEPESSNPSNTDN